MLASRSLSAHPAGSGGCTRGSRAMGWGLGASRKAGLLQLQGSRWPSGDQGVVSQAQARAGRDWHSLPGPGGAATSRHVGRRRSSCSLRCRLPLPSDNKRKAASTSQLLWQPRPPGSCWRCREGGLCHARRQALGGMPGRRGRECEQGHPGVRGQRLGTMGTRVGSATSGTGGATGP